MAGGEFKGEKVPLKNGKGEVEISAPEYTLVSIINDDPAQRITYGDGIIPSPSTIFLLKWGKGFVCSLMERDGLLLELTGEK